MLLLPVIRTGMLKECVILALQGGASNVACPTFLQLLYLVSYSVVKEGSSWVDILHPVNSWYFSKVSTSPASLFGGTWQQITDAVLRSATGYGYGGNDNMTLTISNMPSHSHRVLGNYTYEGPGIGNDALWHTGHTTADDNKWTTSFCEATGGASIFKASPLLQSLLLGQNCVNSKRVM